VITPWTENCFTFTCCDLVLNGIKRGTLVIASDITELMREKAKAQNASKAKGEFLSRVSHELRSPMNVIIGMAKLGLKDGTSSSHERFQNIVSASDHLLRIINDVLDMSRIEAGKIEIKYAQFNIRKVIVDCCSLLKQQAEDKQVALTYSVASDVANEAVGDSSRLSQVIVNLLTNSVKFTEGGGRITLSATSAASDDENLNIAFSVEDTGIGMSEEFMRKMFTPFEQEDQYLQRRYQGTGLGLSICHRLVGLMGGAIEVTSELQVGSKFTFTLPFMRAEEETDATREAETDAVCDFSNIHLLLVDDIALNRMIMAESLADTGIHVAEAGDGAEAVKLFQESEEGYFDIIFMDLQMPLMDGYQATEAIRALPRKDAPYVFIAAMTANAMQEDVEQALSQGMNAHLAKPIDIDACIRVIAKVAASKSQ
jgi:CheY-like chemotaxis protein/nitrogen-specific signal transduction histidine kinase